MPNAQAKLRSLMQNQQAAVASESGTSVSLWEREQYLTMHLLMQLSFGGAFEPSGSVVINNNGTKEVEITHHPECIDFHVRHLVKLKFIFESSRLQT
jgi:hypothetical protein